MNENQAIDNAYSAAIENLYNVFSTSLLMAKGDPAEEEKAETAFKHGLDFNRKVYNKAQEFLK